MSATNQTTNYALPIFISSDVPSWLTDWNGAMTDLDTAIAAAKSVADGAQLTASGASNQAGLNASAITALQTTVGTQGGSITTLQGSMNTVTSLIGNGLPTTTDQTIIGAINELHANQGNLANLQTTDKSSLVAAINEAAQSGGGASSASQVSYDNTGSGLAATDVQDAIDELAQGAGGATVRYNNGYIQYTPDAGTTWINLINTSTPVQLLPVMTSATSSVGSVTSSGITGTAYNAIDGSSGAANAPRFASQDDNITFTFTNATYVKYISTTYFNDTNSDGEIRLDWSVDGNTWISGTPVTVDDGDTNEHNITQNVNATVKAIRIYKSINNGAFKAYKFEAYN